MRQSQSRLTTNIVTVLLCATILCAAATWYLCQVSRAAISDAYDRISPGTPRDKVEGILGPSGGSRQDFVLWLDNRTPFTVAGTDLLNEYRMEPGIEYWYSDRGVIIVRFDTDGEVTDKELLGITVSTVRQKFIRWRERMGW